MAAISHSEADAFLARPSDRYFIYLIFGPDRGLVAERSLHIGRHNFLAEGSTPLQKIDVSGDAIAADPLILVDEANSIDMFEQASRVIRVNLGGKSILPALEMIAQAPPQNCLLLLEAGDLRRDAPLRKWIEAQSFAASIECRQDDLRSVLRLLEQELAATGQSIEPGARDALLDTLGEDRIATRNEIEKLLLYTHGQSQIAFADVEAISHDPNLSRTDAIIDGFFSLSRRETLELVHRALQTGVDPTTILVLMLRHALALQRGLSEIENRTNANDALQTMLRQTGGFARKAEFSSQLKSFSSGEIVELIAILQSFTKASRQNPTLLAERLTRLLLSRPGGRQTKPNERRR